MAGTSSGWGQGSMGTFGVSGRVTTTHSTTSWMTFSSVRIPKCSPCVATGGEKDQTCQNNASIVGTDSEDKRTRVFGCGVPILHRGGAFGRGRAGFPEDGFVAAVLRAGGVSEGVLGGVGVREHHHFTVLTALCQEQKHCGSRQLHTHQCFRKVKNHLLHPRRSLYLKQHKQMSTGRCVI